MLYYYTLERRHETLDPPVMSAAFLASLLAAAVTAGGLLLVSSKAEWTRSRAGLFAAFASGALIVLSLLHLAPEALSKSPRAVGFIAAGLFAGFLIHTVLGRLGGRRRLALGVAPAIAIGFHSFIDGWVYSVTFSADLVTGLLTALGLIVHEFPEGVIVYVLLARAGIAARQAAWIAVFAAALTTPLGVLVSSPFVSALGPSGLGDMLGLAAGLLFYVGAINLAPSLATRPVRRAWAALAAGGVMALAITIAHAHT